MHEISTQTKKVHRENSDDEYDSEEEAVKEPDDIEITGLDKFLARVAPRVFQILDKNVKNDLLSAYDVSWDHGALEETELVHSLNTNYDFIDANTSTQMGLQKLKDAEKSK